MSKKLLRVTTSAVKKLQSIVKENNARGVLFYINSGGCNGFEYRFKPINKFTDRKNVQIENDLNIEVCNKSLMFVLGTKIDWQKDIMGEAFKFKNPIAKNSCGCGTSFSV